MHSTPGISQFQMCPVTLLNEETFSPSLLGNERENTLSFPHRHVSDSLFSIFMVLSYRYLDVSHGNSLWKTQWMTYIRFYLQSLYPPLSKIASIWICIAYACLHLFALGRISSFTFLEKHRLPSPWELFICILSKSWSWASLLSLGSPVTFIFVEWFIESLVREKFL